MALLSAHWRTLAALLIAAVLVVLAYAAALSTAHPPVASAATETELLKAIATKDSDGDGLADWEEALYGTDPNTVDTKGLGIRDGEAVAKGLIVPKAIADVPLPPPDGQSAAELGLSTPSTGSLTDVFGKNFFSLYLAAKQSIGRDLTQEEVAALAAQAIEQLSKMSTPTPAFKSASDITVSGSGADALRTYAAAAEGVFAAHTTSYPKSELEYLQEAINGDISVLKNIEGIASAYYNIAVGLLILPVPAEMKDTHLALVNSLAAIGNIANDFARYDTDPLLVMLALVQYRDTVPKLGEAFMSMSDIFARAGVTFAEGEAGGKIVNAIPRDPKAP